ncbi:dTDP-glucose 4,6-dehydratase [Candidatus Peregrinibacteria bacterium]|nr:dTDP-glucose 4,6-dehydratase [Candidatus Peregrinibacteria bacterium]
MKLLITGGAGFIGSNYCHYHLEKYPEDEIVVLDKLTYAGNLGNLKSIMDEDNFKFVQGDIADKKFIDDFFTKEKFDTVINFAAETHVDRSINGPSIFVQTNIVGTHNVIEAARQNNVKRYHQVSTDEVYGDLGIDSTDYFTESTSIAPNCPYAASKASADLLVMSYFETYQMPVTVSRCSNNYGPFQFPEKLIPYFFKLISEDKPVPVYGDGKNVRDWLYVIDHCRAIDTIVCNGRLGEVYNVGGNNEKTNLEITKFLLDFLGRDESLIRFVDDRLAHDRRYAIDSSKLQNELNWSPTVDFSEGISKTFNWYKENEDWVKDLEDRIEERKHNKISVAPLEASR